MSEIWKDIKGYEGYYQASSLGRICSVDRYVPKEDTLQFVEGRILKSWKTQNGYLSVSLSRNGKISKHSVHRIIADTFLKNPKHFRDVNHKNGKKTDNRVCNLEWVSHSDNIKHSVSKLGHRHWRKRILCVENGVLYDSVAQAAKLLGINRAGVSHNLNGINKSTFGYHFRYKETYLSEMKRD